MPHSQEPVRYPYAMSTIRGGLVLSRAHALEQILHFSDALAGACDAHDPVAMQKIWHTLSTLYAITFRETQEKLAMNVDPNALPH